MAHTGKGGSRGLHIRSSCARGATADVSSIAKNSRDTDHAIELTNYKTYTYDVRARNIVADGSKVAEFDHNGALAESWLSEATRLSMNQSVTVSASIHCGNPANISSLRLATMKLQYKSPTDADWIDVQMNDIPIELQWI